MPFKTTQKASRSKSKKKSTQSLHLNLKSLLIKVKEEQYKKISHVHGFKEFRY